MKCDYLIKNCNLYGDGNWVQDNVDVALEAGVIVSVGENLHIDKVTEVIDGTDKLLMPAFVDSHMHIDKALLMADEEAVDLLSAIKYSDELSVKKYMDMTKVEIYKDILKRADTVLKMCICNGTTAIKSTVVIDSIWGMSALEAMSELKKKYADKIDIYNVVPYYDYYKEQWIQAYKEGKIDFIGGYPDIGYDENKKEYTYVADTRNNIDEIFLMVFWRETPFSSR